MESALYDFAEAAMGKNTAMSWSLSNDVLRRQVGPVFKLCASRELSAEDALDVAIDFVGARVTTMLEVFTKLFNTLASRIDVQMSGHRFPALIELEEFFLGLDGEAQWVTDQEITRRELHTLFEKVYDGRYSAKTGVAVFCDVLTSKKDYYLDLIHGMCLRLAEQIEEAKKAQESEPTDPEGPERMANGNE